MDLIEKGMEKCCSLDSINPHRPDVIELNSKNKVYFCGKKKKKIEVFFLNAQVLPAATHF